LQYRNQRRHNYCQLSVHHPWRVGTK